MMKKRVALVTGVTGFIGSNLARTLIFHGWSVHGIVRADSSRDVIKDILPVCVLHTYDGSAECMLNILNLTRPDVVFHLASLFLSEHKPSDVSRLIDSNILFGSHLLEAMVSSGCSRIVNAGTSWQHFHCQDYRPVNLYASTKQAFEDIVRFYSDAHGVSAITLKLYDTYGQNDRRRKLINIIMESAFNGTLLELSPGEQVLDLSHVDDVVLSFIGAAEHMLNEDSPLCLSYSVSGERMTVRDLVSLISNVLGINIQVSFGARPYRTREVMFLHENIQGVEAWKIVGERKALADEILKYKNNTDLGFYG